ncbi:GAF and ANTAR domain-containing protein [Allonocardiopsis opalescens]|uniref:GAF domain-containing protein n=1 Tax=Allonocardiopsis opalescens TaxID=1144618 RepID=A0A2T0Q9N9_9ACTN|nr:GAF and ANTAR domain-containing protein [Allonocardiopsis opalescens]PRY00563.1 GAF domain-containing protein [Allonocardiopsis opalescens]
MWIERLARDIGSLGRVDDNSPQRALAQVTAAAARGVPGCSAALAVIWRGDVIVEYAASHSDLARSLEYQYALGEGPVIEGLRTRERVLVDDVLHDERWPRFLGRAVQCGDRSSVTFPFGLDGVVVTFGLHSGRPRSFDEATAAPLAALLAEQLALALHSAGRYTDVAREAAHMRRALSSRAVIDQAKGILMHAHGCDAAQAFEQLRRVAQRNQLKVTEVAQRLVDEHAAATADAAAKVPGTSR